VLIRNSGGAPRQASKSKGPAKVQTDRERLETLLTALEKNLELESFFIGRKEIPNLLEMLPGQGDVLRAVVELSGKIPLGAGEAAEVNRRMAAAAEHRERNQKLLQECIAAAKAELDELNVARRRLQQMRTLSKSIYAEPEPSRLENWA
jgi:hypothetical protein